MKRVLVLLIIILFGFCLTGCKSYEYKEDDFKCKISVDKTNVKVGDTINVKVTFENVSGQDIRIKMSHTDQNTLKDSNGYLLL